MTRTIKDKRNQQIGWQLRKLRKMHKLKMRDLAAVAHTTYQQIQKYESGDNQLSIFRICDLAPVFHMSATDLFQYLMGTGSPQSMALANELNKIPLHAQQAILQMVEYLKTNN